jgi:hypothetical protein
MPVLASLPSKGLSCLTTSNPLGGADAMVLERLRDSAGAASDYWIRVEENRRRVRVVVGARPSRTAATPCCCAR